MNAEQILAVPTNRPEQLFRCDRADLKTAYRTLIGKWHPDRCSDPEAPRVTEHINVLHAEAERKIAANTWVLDSGTLLDPNGKWRLAYHRFFLTDVGDTFLAQRKIAARYSEQYRGAAQLATKNVAHLLTALAADAKLDNTFRPLLPKQVASSDGPTSHGAIRVYELPENCFRLTDILAVRDLPIVHVGWIINRVFNLCCMLRNKSMAHNAILPENLYVQPETHQVFLLGGWHYASRLGEKLSSLPYDVASVLPRSFFMGDKRSTERIDAEMIRTLGRTLLKYEPGRPFDASVPLTIQDWLLRPASDELIYQQYAEWEEILLSAFPRKFHVLPLTRADVYPEANPSN